MLRSLWLLIVYMSFLGLSVSTPFIATLGYVWVDTFQPQDVAYIILNQLPVAMIMGAVAVGAYLMVDRRSPPPLSLATVLQIAMAIWVTLTIVWAEVPAAAWEKWDWAFKTLIFAAFVPYAIRSRVQIEAFAQTYVFSLAANFVPFGLKTLISGGGYGTNLGLQQGNSGLSEGGLLSTVCLMTVPLAVFLSRHSQLVPRLKVTPFAYWGIAGLAIVTAIGTYERSALIGLVVLCIYMWVRTKHKLGFGIVIALVAGLVAYTTSSAWTERVQSIGSFETENSAYTRILVWKWTLGYAATHPLGGGFLANLVDHVDVPNPEGGTTTEFGRAFHSIYFEMLGEQGWPGLAMFLGTFALTFLNLRRTAKRARREPELQWVAALSDALQSGLVVFMTSGAFVGIAFQPMFWYFVSMSVSLNAYMWRVENERTGTVAVGWRGLAVIGRNPGRPGPIDAAPNAGAPVPVESWRSGAVRPAATPPQVAAGGWRDRLASSTSKMAPPRQ